MNNYKRSIWITLLFLSLLCTPILQARLLDIKNSVMVTSDDVLLEDFAVNPEILSDDERAFVVLSAPGQGRQRKITLIELAYMLQKYDTLMDLELGGARVVVIEKKVDEGRLQNLKQRITDKLRGMSPWNDWKIDVLFSLDDERKLQRIKDFVDFDIRTLDSDELLGSVPLQVLFYNEKNLRVGDIKLSPVILREVNVIVMAEKVERGDVIRESMLKTSPVWVGDDNRQYILDINDCLGKEINRRLNPGELLRESHLLSPVCAKRGDVVWVYFVRGGLEIKIATSALESGRLGDTIAVRNSVSKKELKVKLTGSKRAVVEMLTP